MAAPGIAKSGIGLPRILGRVAEAAGQMTRSIRSPVQLLGRIPTETEQCSQRATACPSQLAGVDGTLIQFALLRDWFLYQPQVALSTGRRLSRFARLDDCEFRVSQPNPATCSHEGRSSWCRRRVLRPIAASTFKQVNLYPVST
jgi:hypothetical protein